VGEGYLEIHFRKEDLIASPKRLSLLILLIVLAFLPLPLAESSYLLWVLTLCNFYAILAVSWDLILGYGRQLSFAHTGMLAIGAYSSVFLVNSTGLPPAVGMIVGGVLAGAMGLALGWICLRLKGIYFALATWGFAGMVQLLLISEYDITGGLKGLATKFLLPTSSTATPVYYYYAGLALLAACALTSYRLINSNYGLYLMAMGDDEDAVSACGINVVWLKVSVFGISSLWLGLAGSFYAHLLGYVSPAIADFTTVMVLVIAVTIIGGLGTFFGPLFGTFLLYPIAELIRAYGAGIQQLIFIVVILAALKFFRSGIVGLVQSLRRK